MMIIGRGPPPQWVPVHPARVEWIRARLAVTGSLVLVAAVALGIVLVMVGLNLVAGFAEVMAPASFAVYLVLLVVVVVLGGIAFVVARQVLRPS